MNEKVKKDSVKSRRDISQIVLATILKLTLATATLYVVGTTSYINGFYDGKEKTAERAKMALYEPVGNGGAIMEYHGHITERRKQMYENMDKVYEAAIVTPLEFTILP